MTEHYTPTTEEIREYVEVGGEPRPWEEITPNSEAKEAARAAAFDRWLAAHDAQVRAEALRDARDTVMDMERAFVTSEWGTVVRKLDARDIIDRLAEEPERGRR